MSIDWGNIPWGDVPTWVGALTTLGALLAAARVVRIELDREDRAEEMRAEQRDAQDRAHADLVAAWQGRAFNHGDVIHVRNGGQLPIYEVSATVALPGRGGATTTSVKKVIPPGDDFLGYPDEIAALNTGDGIGNSAPDFPGLDAYQVSLHFRDAAGRSWTRHADGWLEHMGVARR